MKEELDNILCERYPKIFADRYKPMTETAMCWGFNIGDGWYQIIDSLCGQIQNHIDWQNRRGVEITQVVATQVKEKFGGLRFYYEGGDDTVDGMVRMAESWASNTCEQCGQPGRTRGHGWIYTSCDTHARELDR